MKKILVLFSGGFDSVILVKRLIDVKNPEDLLLVFFNYGQRNYKQEKIATDKFCKENKLDLIEVDLPKLSWSNSIILNEEKGEAKDEYLEMRNLIFLSYAMSICESKGIKEIQMAVLKSHIGFADTSEEFVNNFNNLSSALGITFNAPFLEVDKEGLAYLARSFKVKKDDFFSCNSPVNGLPCNVCGDCESINFIYDEIVRDNIPVKAWMSNDLKYSKRFEELFLESQITEVRLLTNNDCQFKCSHCFYGFDEMKSKKLPFSGMTRAIDMFIETGIKNVHLSGKEPLFDEEIFSYCEYIRVNYPDITFDMVTNGVNILKYRDEIKKAGFNKIYLSVDSLEDLTIRPTAGHTLEVLKFLQDSNITTQIFIDIHKKNYTKVVGIVEKLNREFNIKEFHLRTVMPIGRGKNLDNIVSALELDDVFLELLEFNGEVDFIEFSMRKPWVTEFLTYEYAITEYLEELVRSGCHIFNKVYLLPEFYCGRYESQVTLTPDGYLLGCGTEVAVKDYNSLAIDNINNIPNSDILTKTILRGKLKALDFIRDENVCGCYHTPYTIK